MIVPQSHQSGHRVGGMLAAAAACTVLALTVAPHGASSQTLPTAGAASPAPKWVEVHRGRFHSIQADIGSADWRLPVIGARILVYQRQGLLGPQRNSHFRLETVTVDCSAYTRTVSQSVLMDTELAPLQQADRLLEHDGGEPATVWTEALTGLCGMSPPVARTALTPEEVSRLTPVAAAGTGALAAAAADFDTALLTRPGAAPIPVVFARGSWWRARDGDCGQDADGNPLELSNGGWSPSDSSCVQSAFMREIRLLEILDRYALGSVELAAAQMIRELPPLARPAPAAPVTD